LDSLSPANNNSASSPASATCRRGAATEQRSDLERMQDERRAVAATLTRVPPCGVGHSHLNLEKALRKSWNQTRPTHGRTLWL
jgi:hypothetical protein